MPFRIKKNKNKLKTSNNRTSIRGKCLTEIPVSCLCISEILRINLNR